MSVLVDTCIWSMALRKGKPSADELHIINILSDTIRELQVVIIGPVRQEILSGIADKGKFNKLRNRLAIFSDFPIHQRDYEYGAELFNKCRKKGIQGSHIDFLLCSVAIHNNLLIFTVDKDFWHISKIVPIKLLNP